MNYYSKDPREITAKFQSACKETGKIIKKGEKCIYYPASKSVFHAESKQAYEFRNWLSDISQGYNY